TRSKRDWSSDVCSSDLVAGAGVVVAGASCPCSACPGCAMATVGTRRPEPTTPTTRGAARREAHRVRGLASELGVAMVLFSSLPRRHDLVVRTARAALGCCPGPCVCRGAAVGSPPTDEPGGHRRPGPRTRIYARGPGVTGEDSLRRAR